MESSEIFVIFMGTHCEGCNLVKRKRSAFCLRCYGQLPRALQVSLWKRFGSGFEEAYHACMSWFREPSNEVKREIRERNLRFEGKS